jgi:vitamin B12 transporter
MRLLILGFLGANTVSAVALQAQAPLTRDTSRLGPTVVTATRSPVPLAATAAAVTVLDGADLRARGIARVVDALREVPSAAVVQQGANGTLTALFLRGGESRYVKVLVDGVPVNEAGGQFDFGQLTTDNIARIEIVRGPASVEWGSDAVAGVVHIITREGSARTSGSLSLRSGTTGGQSQPGFTPSPTGTREAVAEMSGALGTWRWSAGAGAHRGEGIAPFNNRWRNDTWSAALRSAPGRTTLALTLRGTDGNTQIPTSSTGAFTDSNAFRLERRLVAGAEVQRQLTSRVRGVLTLSTNELRAINRNDADSPGDTLGFISRNTITVFRRIADARLVTDLVAGARLTTGVEVQEQGELNAGVSQFARLPVSTTRFDQRRSNTGLYASLVAVPDDRVALNAGARLDRNSVFGSFLTLRNGISVGLGADTRVRGAVGTAFREPNFNEQFNTTFSRGNPGLVPEQTTSWDAGLEHTVAGVMRLGATWFDQRFTNLIQFVSAPAPRPNYENLARATARGVELEAALDPTALDWLLSGSWTYLRTEVVNPGTGSSGTFVQGQTLLRRPRMQAQVTVGKRFRRLGTLQVMAQHVGQRADQDFAPFPSRRVVLPAFQRYDVSWDVPFGREPAAPAVTLRLENATNTAFQQIVGFAQPGRVVLLGLRAGFGR